MQNVIIIGAGGHGKEVAWNIAAMNAKSPTYTVVGFCDDKPAPGMSVLGHPILGPIEAVAATHGPGTGYICAVGRNAVRPALVARAEAAGWIPVTVVHPTAVIAAQAEIGAGTFIAPGCYVGPSARLGRHGILNFHCSIGHDAVLGDHVQACPGVRVSGGVSLGEGVFLGSNAAVAPGITMGAWSKLSACSFAAVHVPEHALALGVPARIVPSPKVS